MPHPDRLLPARRYRAGSGGAASGPAARYEELSALGHRALAAGQLARVREHHLSEMRRSGRARDRYARRLRLFVVVLSALRFATLRPRAVRARDGGLLAAGRS